MDLRNKIGLYGSYFFAMSGVGFTLPYLPLYLAHKGVSDRAIGIIATIAAVASLIQFPLGIWSDRVKRRKPFLLVLYVLLTISTFMLRTGDGLIWLSIIVIFFAENGLCRAPAESLSGAAAACLSPRKQVGAALGALRFWRPVGIILVCVGGGFLAKRYGIGAILLPLTFVQALAVACLLFLHEDVPQSSPEQANQRHPASGECSTTDQPRGQSKGLRDGVLWTFVAAMVLFHVANAPGGLYIGLFLSRTLKASDQYLSYAFIVDMIAWMLVVWPAGKLGDKVGRKPMLLAGWTMMTLRLVLVGFAHAPWQVLATEVLDGAAQALFIVAAASWVTERLADPGRVGEAQVLVGSALVAGSAIGPLLSGLVVNSLGYRVMFWLLAGIGTVSTAIVLLGVPETLRRDHNGMEIGAGADRLSTSSGSLARTSAD